MARQIRRLPILFLLGLCITLCIAACGTVSDRISFQQHSNINLTNCRIVKHDVGETRICGIPQTIAVLGPNALDLTLSLHEQPDAYADVFVIHSGKIFDNPSQQIPYLGDRITTRPINLGNRDQPSLEALYALKPDLILGEVGGGGATYDALSRIAPTIFWDMRTQWGKWRTTLRQIAQALGDEPRADEVITAHEQRIQQAQEQFISVATAHPTVLLLGANDINNSITVIKSNSYLGELFEALGFQLVSVPSQLDSVNLSVEVLPTLKADTIFVLGHDLSAGDEAQRSSTSPLLDRALKRQTSTIQKSWQENPIAQSLSATQQSRVFFTTYYLWNGLNGPIGAELVIEQLRQFLL
jgi:iron complex transport system substrate-binding protein